MSEDSRPGLFFNGIPLTVIAILAALSGGFLLAHLDPVSFPDSEHYLLLADGIRHWEWKDFYFRTPGYPVFLALVQLITGSQDVWNVAAMQVVLGLTVPFFLYGICFLVSQSRLMALILACTYFLNLKAQLLSVAILTESLLQTMFVATVFFSMRFVTAPGLAASILLSVLTFGLAMIKPVFLPFAGLIGILTAGFAYRAGNLSRAIYPVACYLVIFYFFCFLWCLEVKRETGKFAVSHITGIALINQVIPYLHELQPTPGMATKNILLEEARRSPGDGMDVGWTVTGRQLANGVPAWQTADELKVIAVDLIKAHPVDFLRKVYDNCVEYWTWSGAYVYQSSGTTEAYSHVPAIGQINDVMHRTFGVRPGRLLLLLALTAAAGVYILCAGKSLPLLSRVRYAVIVGGLAIYMAAHVLINGCDLARYRLPTDSLYVGTVGLTFFLFVKSVVSAAQYKRVTTTDSDDI